MSLRDMAKKIATAYTQDFKESVKFEALNLQDDIECALYKVRSETFEEAMNIVSNHQILPDSITDCSLSNGLERQGRSKACRFLFSKLKEKAKALREEK